MCKFEKPPLREGPKTTDPQGNLPLRAFLLNKGSVGYEFQPKENNMDSCVISIRDGPKIRTDFKILKQ